jgi:hypothetical protein
VSTPADCGPAAATFSGIGIKAALEEARKNALPLETRTIILNYARAADVARTISPALYVWHRPPLSTNVVCRVLFVPAQLHLAPGISGQLRVVDDNGNTIEGMAGFDGYDTSLVSVSSDGVVSPLRVEAATNEIGTLVSASINGVPVTNSSVVRVLSKPYNLRFDTVSGTNTILYYPTTIQDEPIANYVADFQLSTVNEYAYSVQTNLMGGRPFNGARQIIEVDFGETEGQRVCGRSGNPFRLCTAPQTEA